MHAVVVDDVMSDHTVLTLGYVRSQGLCSRGNTGLVKADVGCTRVGCSAPKPLVLCIVCDDMSVCSLVDGALTVC